MAIATDTTQGSVLMTGDLYGMGTEPVLRPTGVTPGGYTIPKLVVDAKGRIIAAGLAEIDEIPCATETTCGIASIGRNIKYSSGEADLYLASTSAFGVVKAGSGVRVEDGVISAELPIATGSVLGVVKVGDGLAVDNDGVLTTTPYTMPIATTTTPGSVMVPSSQSLSITVEGAVSLNDATTSSKGVIVVGSGLTSSGGVLSTDIPIASGFTKGGIKVDGGGFTVTTGVLTYSGIPTGTSTTKGAIKVPTANGLAVDVNGSVSYTPTTATNSVKGIAAFPTAGNLVIDGSGNVSVPKAQTEVFGIVKGGGFVLISSGNPTVSTMEALVLNETRVMSVAPDVTPGIITASGNVELNIIDNAIHHITLQANTLFLNIQQLNMYEGLSFALVINRSGNTMSWEADYLFPGGNRVLTQAPVYLINCIILNGKIYCVPTELF